MLHARFLRLVLALLTPLALGIVAGCSESHTGDTIDTGILLVDSSLPPGDGSTVRPDSAIMPGFDAGLPPDVDAFVIPPGTDAGTIMPDVDTGVVMPPVDAGPPGVTCGAATCVDPQICCVTFGGGGMMASMTCTAPDGCMGVAAACDGPEDCATGEACCGMRGPGGGSTSCVAEAMCGFGRLCHADTDCTGMDTCCAFMGANVCSPFCRP